MNSVQLRTGFSVGAILLFLSCCGSLEAQTRPVAVLGGTLIDGTGRPAVTDAAVVMQGGRFQQVGKRGQVTVPPGAEVIEAAGKTILPGLIDSHCHYQPWQGELYLAMGVATCSDLLAFDSTESTVAMREAIQKGEARGPRLWVTGIHLDGPPRTEMGAAAANGNQVIVRTPEEARKAVREEVEKGVDGIKFYERMTPEVTKAAAEEAHRLGRPVLGHSLDIFVAADAGYQSVEHFWAVVFTTIQDPKQKEAFENRRVRSEANALDAHLYMDPVFYSHMEPKMFDRIIRVMVDKNVHWNPTFSTWFRALSPRVALMKQQELALLKETRGMPPNSARRAEEVYTFYENAAPERRAQLMDLYKKMQDFARRFVAAGGKIHVGSDPNHVTPGFAVHTEMELLVEAGLSPLQVIQGASLNPAQAWRKEKDYGSVEKGKVADLTLVRGDLTKDITVSRNVEMLFRDGKLVGGSEYSNH